MSKIINEPVQTTSVPSAVDNIPVIKLTAEEYLQLRLSNFMAAERMNFIVILKDEDSIIRTYDEDCSLYHVVTPSRMNFRGYQAIQQRSRPTDDPPLEVNRSNMRSRIRGMRLSYRIYDVKAHKEYSIQLDENGQLFIESLMIRRPEAYGFR